ncbi:hypothetical protein C8F01DRAFT_1311871 [Mycena amicta]|nr:hypothetical protein C8F01DRAFT_1311871 [Mycena amicta]
MDAGGLENLRRASPLLVTITLLHRTTTIVHWIQAVHSSSCPTRFAQTTIRVLKTMTPTRPSRIPPIRANPQRKLKDAYGPRRVPRRFIDGLRTLHTALAALRHKNLVSHIALSLPSWSRTPDGVDQRARLFSRNFRIAWVPRHTDQTRIKLRGNDGVRGWHASNIPTAGSTALTALPSTPRTATTALPVPKHRLGATFRDAGRCAYAETLVQARHWVLVRNPPRHHLLYAVLLHTRRYPTGRQPQSLLPLIVLWKTRALAAAEVESPRSS